MYHKDQVTQSPHPPRLTNPTRRLAKRPCVTEAHLPQGKEIQIGTGFLPGENTFTGGEHYGSIQIAPTFSITDFQSRVA